MPPRRRGRLARYRRVTRILVRHGFGYVLDEIGVGKLVPYHWGILGHRRRGTRYSQPEHLRLAFEELGTGFVKLGQILSTRSDLLSPEFIDELAKLRDRVPAEPAAVIEATIRAELGKPLTALFATFERKPLAAASIGQVHTARLKSGEDVVVKVQRPRVKEVIDEDVSVLMDLARLARAHTAFGRIYDLPALVDEFSDTLAEELDYTLEADNARRFRDAFASEPRLHVPEIFDEYTTSRVLTMERIRGVPIDRIDALEGIDRGAIAIVLLQTVLRMVLRDGFFHADPHPGNFFAEPDGRLAVLDFGLVGRLDDTSRVRLLQFLDAARRHDLDRMADRLTELGVLGSFEQLERFRTDLGRFLALYWERATERSAVGGLFDVFLSIARRHRMRIPSSLALVSKTLVIHEENARRLDPGLTLSSILDPLVEELAAGALAPSALAHRLRTVTADAGELALTLPRRVDRLVGLAERGRLTVRVRSEEVDRLLIGFQRNVNQLVLAVLLGAFLVGNAVLLAVAHSAGFHRLLIWLLTAGLVLAVLLSGRLVAGMAGRGLP